MLLCPMVKAERRLCGDTQHPKDIRAASSYEFDVAIQIMLVGQKLWQGIHTQQFDNQLRCDSAGIRHSGRHPSQSQPLPHSVLTPIAGGWSIVDEGDA